MIYTRATLIRYTFIWGAMRTEQWDTNSGASLTHDRRIHVQVLKMRWNYSWGHIGNEAESCKQFKMTKEAVTNAWLQHDITTHCWIPEKAEQLSAALPGIAWMIGIANTHSVGSGFIHSSTNVWPYSPSLAVLASAYLIATTYYAHPQLGEIRISQPFTVVGLLVRK